ncbi:MAG: hypothetical protein ACLFQT_10395 [Thiohalophilus sp.]
MALTDKAAEFISNYGYFSHCYYFNSPRLCTHTTGINVSASSALISSKRKSGFIPDLPGAGKKGGHKKRGAGAPLFVLRL